tara:strand:- start:66 stop:1442 length:1377 start_codon:yes stop_codon:yes gene_type:complete
MSNLGTLGLNKDTSLIKTVLETIQEKEILKNVQYKLPDIDANPNKIYRNYLKEGLQPAIYKTKEELFEAVKFVLNHGYVNGNGNGNGNGKLNGKQLSLGEALQKLFPEGYEGIPLAYSKSGSSRKGNRVIKEVMFDKRAFREQIPLEIKKWFILNQEKGLIPADSLEKYTKYINKGNTRNAAIAKRLSKLTGIKFDKGHIFALFSDGTNDPAAQIAELLSENRGKGGIDNIPKNLADIIDTPKNWQQSAFEFVNRQTGGTSGSGLPVDNFGKSLSDGDIASIARHGANPDQVVASKWKKVFDAIEDAELAKANNTIPEYLSKIQSRVDPVTRTYKQTKPVLKQAPKGNLLSLVKQKTGRVLDIASPVIKTVEPVLKVAPYVGTAIAIEGARSGISKAAQEPTAENVAYATGKSAAAILELDPTGITPTLVDTATETFLTKEGRENLKKNADKYDFSTL